jgi:hypothetical protein
MGFALLNPSDGATPRPTPTISTHQEDVMFVNRRSILLVSVVVAAAAAAAAIAPAVLRAETPAPAGATVYFINLKDGDMVTSPFKVQFGLTGMGIAPAGIERPNTGHHHVFVDTRLADADAKSPIPMNTQHLHFGGGQTETTLMLPAGTHTLQLVLGDWSHIPFVPPIVSPVINVTVK